MRQKINKVLRYFAVFSFILLLFAPLLARKAAELPRHLVPSAISVDHRHMYVLENSTVYIYTLDGFAFIKTFGKAGEGPGEFKDRVKVHAHTDVLQVNSRNRVTFFSKTGDYIKEVNNISGGRDFYPLPGNRYSGNSSWTGKDGQRYSGIYIYDSQFKKKHELIKIKSIVQPGKGWSLFSKTYFQHVECGGNVFTASGTDFEMGLFDAASGKKHPPIHMEYKRVKFSSKHKEKVLGYYKVNPVTKMEFDWWKKNIHFPDRFPAVRFLISADGKVFVRTYEEKKERHGFYVFDSKGRMLKKVFLPIAKSSAKISYPYLRDSAPFAIKNGKLYQLITNEDTDAIEIHVDEIK